MKKLNSNELISVCGGGFSFTATFLNAAIKAVDLIFEIGRSIGSSLRRVITHDFC